MKQRIVAAATRPEFWLVSLLLWLLLSAGRSLGTPWARVALTEALRWSAGVGLALALGFFFRHTKTAARFVVTLVGTLALLGIGEGFQPDHGGMTGPYHDHQLYGSVLLLLLPPVVAVALTAHDFRWRLGGAAAAGMGALCLALSQTRSAWAGALAAAVVFIGLWLWRSSRRQEGRNVLLSAAALAGALLAVWLLLAPLDLRAPLAARVGTLSALDVDHSWQARLATWQGASRLAAAHPVCGIGLGRYPDAQWAWTRIGRPLEPSERPSLSEEAHDFYLQTIAEIGLIGLGLYGAALAAFVFQSLHYLRQSRRSHWGSRDALVIASLSLVAGQAVDAVASPSWQFAEASLFFWALLGLGMAARRSEEPQPAPALVLIVLRRAGRFALSGGVAVALAANILPMGLLTPVEAYTPPSGATFRGAAITGSALTANVGDTVYYTMIATYTKGSTTYTANVSNESTTFFSASNPLTTTYGTFTQDAAHQRVAYVVPSSTRGKTLMITGKFSNGGGSTQTTQNTTLTVGP